MNLCLGEGLEEEAGVGDADIDRRLVVVSAVQEALGELGLDDYLFQRVVVDAQGDAMALGPGV